MTQRRELAATIARAIFDRIERDRTLILQNVEEVVRDALVLDQARQSSDPSSEIGRYVTGRFRIEGGKYVRFIVRKLPDPWRLADPSLETNE